MTTSKHVDRVETVLLTGLSNREFLERYAAPGRVGLCGGVTLVDRAIARTERHLDDQGRWSYWSHALLFQGRRHDDHHWVIESDLHVAHKSGIDLTPGRSVKNTTPEDISRTPVPHTTYLLKRQVASSKLSALANRVRQRVRRRVQP